MVFAAGGIEEMDFSQLIIDQGIPITGEASNIGAIVVQSLGNRLRAEIVTENPDVTRAAGKKVDLVAAVDGKEVGSSIVRNLDRVEALERGDPDGAGASAAVVSPRYERGVIESEGGSERRVGDVRTVRRHLALMRHRERQARGHAALGGNGKQ